MKTIFVGTFLVIASHVLVAQVSKVAVQSVATPRAPADCELASTDADHTALPPSAHAILASRYKSWKIAATCKETAQALAANDTTTTPSVAVGDFDNDASRDYAVMLERRVWIEWRSLDSVPTNVIIVALLSRGETFLPVFAGGGGEFITRVARGTRDHNYDTGTYFTHTADGIYSGTLEKTGGVSIYRDGKFIGVHTVD